MKDEKSVMVFGSFDGLHDGHHFFLAQASKLGKLVIVVARDLHIQTLKKHTPRLPLDERTKVLKTAYPEAEIVVSDEVLESWQVIRNASPDIIALGYDQKELAKSLFKMLPTLASKPEIRILPAYKPETFHSSILP